MRRFILYTSLSCVVLFVAGPAGFAAELGDELLKNGNFETADADGKKPASWTWASGAKWESDGQNHWIVEEAKTPASLSVGQRVPMEERFWKIRVSCRVKVTDVVLGKESWHDARIAMSFHDANNKMVGAWPNVLHFTGSTADWESHQRDYIVPPGAAYLSLSCSLFSTTGKVEWDDVSVKLLKFDPGPEDAKLPSGVTARWDLESAAKEETATRGRVCINGLWRFHPVPLKESSLPAAGTGWGYLKVPGTWSPATSRQRPIGPDIWEDTLDLAKTDAAWYQRTVQVPPEWAGRSFFLNIDNPKHSAKVFVDGKEAGKVEWPGGRVDVTALVSAGKEHLLSVYTLALPLEEEQFLVMGPDVIEKARAEVRFKGLCGDCWLESEPAGPKIADFFVKPSVRQHRLGLQCEMQGLEPAQRYRLKATVREGESTVLKEFSSDKFEGTNLATFDARWANPKLWDIDQPNLYTLSVSLLDAKGTLLDETTPIRFGFREFWIQGKDFYLNGSRIHLRCLDYFNAGRDFGLASYDQARQTLARARQLGFNYVIHSHYDYEPQSFATLDDTLRAGDEAGFPMSHSVRHVKTIYRDFENPEKRKLWDRVVDYEVRRVRNHPSIFMWAMNHNFTGWADDQNPMQLDGAFEPTPQDDPGLAQRRNPATLAEKFVMERDGTRPCYHHQSGTFNQMITLNCYLCWTPLQERIEWVSRWAEQGMKPLFFVEWGLPHQASWGGHREGPFIWRNSVNSEPLVAEFGAIYNGDRAYDLTEYDLRHYETIERVYAKDEPFHISGVLGAYWANGWEHNFIELKSLHTFHTWRAFRTYGVPAILPWDQGDLFRAIPEGTPQRREERREKRDQASLLRAVPGASGQVASVATDWDKLQRPGVAPDDLAWTNDWLTCPKPEGRIEPTSLGKTFEAVNKELLAFIAGPPERFTAQDHVFSSVESVVKQIVIINDLREQAKVLYEWKATLGGKSLDNGSGRGKIAPGDKLAVPLQIRVPDVTSDTEGVIELTVKAEGRGDERLGDTFSFTVLPKESDLALPASAKIACYDPKGITSRALREVGVPFESVSGATPPAGCSLFIVGRESVGMDGPGLDMEKMMASAGTVLIFEQTEEVLQKRWGFRTASPGTRRVFVRQPGHPVCAGLTDELLRDWRGNSTLLEPYPQRTGYHGRYPRQIWCGFDNSRTWQWGNYGTVASVVIEKPQKGNWSFSLDCEFDLQYAPLCEWLLPQGRAIFCQLDLSGRDRPDPVANRVLSNLLKYAAQPPKTGLSPASYVGNESVRLTLENLGADMAGGPALIVGPGADVSVTKDLLAKAQTVVCLGMSGEELSALFKQAGSAGDALPSIATQEKAVTHTLIGRPTSGALLGLGNSDMHWRGRMPIQAIVSAPPELKVLNTGVFAEGTYGGKRFVLVQFLPTQFDYAKKPYLKLSYRRAAIALARILTNCGIRLHAPVGEQIAPSVPLALDLSGPWRFMADPEKKVRPEEVAAADFDDSGWRQLNAPGLWEGQSEDLKSYDGTAWYRKEFTAPNPLPTGELTLQLGAVDDEDWTYLNGKLIGHVGQDTHPDNYWAAARVYKLSTDDLKPGRNIIVVKVEDLRGGGGIVGGPLGIFQPGRWLNTYYLDVPTALDDPYRYNRW